MKTGWKIVGLALVLLAVFIMHAQTASSTAALPASGTNVYAWRFFSQDWITMSAPTSEGSYHWRLTDDGWENIPYGLTSIAPDRSFYRWAGNDIERSTDCGDTWAVIGSCPLAGRWGLSPSPITGTLFVNASDGAYKTSDGYSWHRVYTRTLHSFVFSPDFGNDGLAFAEYGGYGSLYWTHDGGESWEYWDIHYTSTMELSNLSGIPPWKEVHFSPQFAEDQTIFVMTQSQLYRSVDRGQTWDLVVADSLDFVEDDRPSLNYLMQMSVSPHYGDDHTILLGMNEVAPHISRDGGDTWQKLDFPMSGDGESHVSNVGLRYMRSILGCPSALPLPPPAPGPHRVYLPIVACCGEWPFEVWAFTGAHLYRSRDGETWEEIIIFEALATRLYLPLARRGY